MDLTDGTEREAWLARLGDLYADRLVVAGFGPLAGLMDWVEVLRHCRARKPLLVVTGRGAGPVPDLEDAEVVTMELPPHGSMTEELRIHQALARDLPDGVRAAVERYDPRGEAVWCLSPFVVDEPVLGRPVTGGRPATWLALEDKLLADEIWAAVAAPHAPSRIVSLDRAGLRRVGWELDHGAGVVWAGDARDGFNGGGDFVRWVTAEESDSDLMEAAYSFFSSRCDRVRVMPFLEGVPCSVHGIVLPTGTAAFRPVELAIMRDPVTRRFVYGGQGTFWDPADEDREQMRDLVRRVGQHLCERVGYRGAFGIDGIMTRHGFRPTELNTRMPGGLAHLARVVDITAFHLLQLNLLAGRDPGVSPEDLEAWALPIMDELRSARPIAVTDARLTADPVEIPLDWDGTALHRAETPTDTTLTLGPTPMGTYAKLGPCRELRDGERVGPLNVALLAFLDTEFGAGFGAVEAAPSVR